jgi:isoamylase
MTDQDWDSGFAKSLAVFFNGDALLDVDERGVPIRDDSFLLLFNGHHEPVTFRVPDKPFSPRGAQWHLVLSTDHSRSPSALEPGDTIDAAARSVTLLSCGSAVKPG